MEKELIFRKETDTWYIDLPQWHGPKANLAMVAGADTMLDNLSGFTDICKMKISSESIPSFETDGFITKTNEPTGFWKSLFRGSLYGQYYKASGLYTGLIWLCPVTKFVCEGRYPKTIHYKII